MTSFVTKDYTRADFSAHLYALNTTVSAPIRSPNSIVLLLAISTHIGSPNALKRFLEQQVLHLYHFGFAIRKALCYNSNRTTKGTARLAEIVNKHTHIIVV